MLVAVNVQHIAIFAWDEGAQHPICCQYLQGFDRDLLVVKNRAIWALKTAQNRCENASKLPKIALNRSILLPGLRHRDTGSIFNICQHLQVIGLGQHSILLTTFARERRQYPTPTFAPESSINCQRVRRARQGAAAQPAHRARRAEMGWPRYQEVGRIKRPAGYRPPK